MSAQPNQNIKKFLVEVCKKDYENTTNELLFEKVNYKTTKDNLLIIIDNLKD